jgi:hypothetical protein
VERKLNKNSTVSGVGGRGLCAGVAQNNAGKTALSAAVKNAAKWSDSRMECIFWLLH